MTVTVNHAKTNAISDWTQAQLDEQIALGNFAPGTTLANIVLPSDWNDDHTLTGLGTMAEQNANNVAITGGSVNGTTIGATTASTGKFTSVTTPSVTATTTDLTLSAISTGVVNLNTLNGTGLRLTELTGGTINSGLGIYSGTSSQNTVYATPYGTFANSNMYLASKGSGTLFLGTSSNNNSVALTQAAISHTASAVNYVQVTGSATGSPPIISAQGSDTNIALRLYSKGTNAVSFWTNNGGSRQFQVNHATGTVVNYAQVSGSVTGSVPSFGVDGTDTNISMAFQPKGTGAIDLAAGSSGVNISNGGTVTAITRTTNGTGYTSFPTVAITAPTTAGGVQAVATVTNMQSIGASISAGGTGYTVGNVITITGGTPVTVAATFTVSAVSSGVVTAVTALNFAPYTVLPTAPVSTTGGSGTGLTLTALTWAIGSSFTISNAGSGYIEQPTITFSGGGGSGAAAYATVGSSVRLQSLGTTSEVAFAFRGASGINSPTAPDILRLLDTSALIDTGLTIQNSQFGRAQILAYGNANGNLFLGANGSGRVTFTTGGTSIVEQLRVAHTASAVNYVQVTGAATGGAPTISAQGSDANVSITIASKNVADARLQSNGGNVALLTDSGLTALRAIPRVASGDTFLDVQRAVGFIDLIASSGVTDGDIRFTPKGAGNVRFGTYTAGVLTPTGYVTIKDSGGTSRRLLVG